MAERWTVVAILKLDATMPTLDQVLEEAPSLLESRIPLAVEVERCFQELGHEITERGVGFGEQDLGAILESPEAHRLALELLKRFRKARMAELLRVVVHPLPN